MQQGTALGSADHCRFKRNDLARLYKEQLKAKYDALPEFENWLKRFIEVLWGNLNENVENDIPTLKECSSTSVCPHASRCAAARQGGTSYAATLSLTPITDDIFGPVLPFFAPALRQSRLLCTSRCSLRRCAAAPCWGGPRCAASVCACAVDHTSRIACCQSRVLCACPSYVGSSLPVLFPLPTCVPVAGLARSYACCCCAEASSGTRAPAIPAEGSWPRLRLQSWPL